MKKGKKHISKKHLSIIPVVLLLGILIGLLPLFFRTTQHVSAASPNKRVVGTFTFTSGGVSCPTATDNDLGQQVCILSQVPMVTAPATIDCVWSSSGASDPNLNGQWHKCYGNGYPPYNLSTEIDVYSKNGNLNLSLLQGGSIGFGDGTITVVYSASQ